MTFEETPIAYYRVDYSGDIMFRKNNTLDVRKNDHDFTTGWIKGLYSEDYVKKLKTEIDRLSQQIQHSKEVTNGKK